mgnify:FL=1
MKKENQCRILALLVLVGAFFLLEATKQILPAQDFLQKEEASRQAEACYQAICQEKLDRGLSMDPGADINKTGMIGLDYSYITTTVGNLEAKRTSTNPNMAAVVVDMLQELKLQPGDKVAVNCSGSFPALNIAVMCAVGEMELDPFLITSFGSSTHGANDPEFTYLDMEHLLVSKGLLTHKSDLFSIGGMEDVGKEMPQDVIDTIVARIKSYGYTQFYDDDLIHNVLARYDIYRSQGDVKCFINVGGNDASFGDSSVMVHTDGGILTQLSEKDNSTGLVQLFLKDGTPVIHLLNIKTLAADYGLPIDPVPIPSVGQGGVYYEICYQRWIALTAFGLAALLLYLGRERKKPEEIPHAE